jgi:transposase InsO family protein
MNFDIKHIEGVNNIVADLFSRLVFDNSRARRPGDVYEGPIGVNSTDVSRHKYMVAAMCVQREYPIRQAAEGEMEGEPEEPVEPLVLFDTTDLDTEKTRKSTNTIRQQVQTTADLPTEGEPELRGGDNGPVITELPNPTEEQIHAWLSEVHNAFVGHMGFHQTMKRLQRRKHTWVKMGADISRFIKECPYCQKYDQRDNHEVIAKPFVSSLAYTPMRRLCIDTIGELPETGPVNGYKFVLVVLDTFSRWVELYPLRSTGAIEAADALLDHFCRYGEPEELQSDRGNQFVNSLIAAITSRTGIHQALSLAYSKQENGRVERANKEVYRHLNALLFHHRVRTDWHKLLPFVRRIMNTQVHEVTGHSPAQLLFGETLNFDRFAVSGAKEGVGARTPNALLAPDQTEHLTQSEFTYWLQDRIKQQNTVLSIAQSLQRHHDERHIDKVKDTDITEFSDGSLVVVKPHDNPLTGRRPTTKFDPKWAGPYRIVSHDGNTYRLKDLIMEDTFIDRHIRDLKPFRFDPRYTKPIDVVARERQEMFVEEIVAHTGDPTKKKEMTFRVRWLGFGQDRDTYEPWTALESNTLLHRYLLNNDMGKLIPPRFRDLYDTVVPGRKRKRKGEGG